MKFYEQAPIGWKDILDKLENIDCTSDIVIQQIKEKFGGLRVYYSGTCPIFEKAVREAEEASYNTCQICGKTPANMVTKNYWMRTLCEEHK